MSQSSFSFVTDQFVADSDDVVDEVKISPPEEQSPDKFLDEGKCFK